MTISMHFSLYHQWKPSGTRALPLFSPYAFHGTYSHVTLSGPLQRLHFSTQTTCVSLSCSVGTS